MKESNKINKSTLSESSTVADATGAAIQGAKMNERPLLTTKPDNNPAPPAGKECGLDAKLEGEPKSLGNVTSEQAITEQRKEDKEYLRVKRKAAQRAWTLMYDGAHNGSQSYALVDQYDLTRGEHLTLEQASKLLDEVPKKTKMSVLQACLWRIERDLQMFAPDFNHQAIADTGSWGDIEYGLDLADRVKEWAETRSKIWALEKRQAQAGSAKATEILQGRVKRNVTEEKRRLCDF